MINNVVIERLSTLKINGKYVNDDILCYILNIDDNIEVKRMMKAIGISPQKIMGFQDMYDINEIYKKIDKIIEEVQHNV